MEKLTYHMSIILFSDQKCFGPGPMKLLRGVEKTGSLHQSADELGMAYSKAWKIIKEMENSLGFPLLLRKAGGAHGGGSSITPKGKIFLEKYEELVNSIEKFGTEIFQKIFDEKFFEEINK
ncbi:winged helix-turn-helix domain-containing protein [Faecalimonas sp.]